MMGSGLGGRVGCGCGALKVELSGGVTLQEDGK